MTKTFRIALIMQGHRGWIGGMEYIRNIIFALASLSSDERSTFEVSLLASQATDHNFIESVRTHLKEVYIPNAMSIGESIKGAVIRRVKRRNFSEYERILEDHDFDFVYPYETWPGPQKAAAWIYDFQHKYLPGLFTDQEIRARDKEFANVARHAPLVVLSSRSAEADFKKFYPDAMCRTGVLSFRTIPHKQWYETNPPDIQQKYHLPEKFFIISNQFWQHKNHLTVFNALQLLKKRGVQPVVVCTGHIYDYRKPEYSDQILQTIHKFGLAQQVFLLGMIPRIDQVQLLRRSVALIQPSLFEGWSTVVEDARCLGKPLILSDFPVHLEQNPPDSRFFERTSAESLALPLMDLWEVLSPGPDLELESIARETNKKEVVRFAEKFLAIARSFQDKK